VHAGQDFAANTHVIEHAGRTLATVEAGALPYEMRAELSTRGPFDFGGSLPGGFAPHAKLDRQARELHRWVADPAVGKVIGSHLDDRLQEFPRVDERALSRPHRFAYSAVIGEVSRATISFGGDFADHAFGNALLKDDLAHRSVEAHEFGRDATAVRRRGRSTA
jgi:carotenoid cleavage dioxygenase-like enzyme